MKRSRAIFIGLTVAFHAWLLASAVTVRPEPPPENPAGQPTATPPDVPVAFYEEAEYRVAFPFPYACRAVALENHCVRHGCIPAMRNGVMAQAEIPKSGFLPFMRGFAPTGATGISTVKVRHPAPRQTVRVVFTFDEGGACGH